MPLRQIRHTKNTVLPTNATSKHTSSPDQNFLVPETRARTPTPRDSRLFLKVPFSSTFSHNRALTDSDSVLLSSEKAPRALTSIPRQATSNAQKVSGIKFSRKRKTHTSVQQQQTTGSFFDGNDRRSKLSVGGKHLRRKDYQILPIDSLFIPDVAFG